MSGTVERYTDAPEAYDGFGTETIARVGTSRLACASGNPVRLVRIRAEHEDWQLARYNSGCYAFTTPHAPLRSWAECELWEIDPAALDRLLAGAEAADARPAR